MDYKKTLVNLLICLILSPVIVYLFLGVARLAGATYEMTHGETFMIWLLMAIMINLSMAKKVAAGERGLDPRDRGGLGGGG
jgi:hypothetical protein